MLLVAGLLAAPGWEPDPRSCRDVAEVPVGRQFDAFWACCRGLGVGETRCRELWLAQVTSEATPLSPRAISVREPPAADDAVTTIVVRPRGGESATDDK
jgi:hypothetical protein